MEFAITCSIVSTFTTGWFGSTAQTSFLRAGLRAVGSPSVRTHYVDMKVPKMNCDRNVHLALGRQFVTPLRGVLNHATIVGPGAFEPALAFRQRVSVREELAGQVPFIIAKPGAPVWSLSAKARAGDQRDAHSGQSIAADGCART